MTSLRAGNLISILMPVKNAGAFLKECLSSILSQTDTRWELLAVDDHSSDDSMHVLESFAKKDERIIVLKNTGSGIIDALRSAYSESTGRLITRMDADDRMSSDKLEVLKENLLREGKGNVAVGRVEYFSDTELGQGYINYETWLNGLTEKGVNYTDIYRECVIPSPCWMVFREDLERCGAFIPNIYPEDYDLCFRFYRQGLKPVPCSKVLHYWHDHVARTSRNHPHYADNSFLKLKLHWFLKLDHRHSRPLVLWGAGSKGKELARGLLKADVSFRWVCNNEKKIGRHIHGQEMLDAKSVSEMDSPQFIVAVANKEEQNDIREQLSAKGSEHGEDSFFFC